MTREQGENNIQVALWSQKKCLKKNIESIPAADTGQLRWLNVFFYLRVVKNWEEQVCVYFPAWESVRINIHYNEGRYKVEFYIFTVLFIARIAIDLGFSFCNMPCGKLISTHE